MTSQRWTRIRPPISPLPPPPPFPFSPGSQQTGCQVALPALPKVLPLIPLPSSTPLHSPLSQTHTMLSHSFQLYITYYTLYSFIPSMVCLWSIHQPFWSKKEQLHPFTSLCAATLFLSPITTGNPLLFTTTSNDKAWAGEGRHIYGQDRAQMKCPLPLAACSGLVLFHRNYKLSPPPAGTITPLAL